MIRPKPPVTLTVKARLLTAAEFQRLAEVPAEAEWFKNIRNQATKRAYENAIADFMRFTGIRRPEEFRDVTRAHVIAWRDQLGERISSEGESLSGTTIRGTSGTTGLGLRTATYGGPARRN